MIKRSTDLKDIKRLLGIFPVVALLGPRQCGKSTLASLISAQHRFDLEKPQDLVQLDNPQLFFDDLKGLVVIDEVQRKKDLFPFLRYTVDHRKGLRFFLLGSASRDLIANASESLAGRIGYYELGGFCLDDIPLKNSDRLWLQGGLPLAFIYSADKSFIWRENYVRSFLERDIPQLGFRIPTETLRRFWIMLAHYHGQILNTSELARSFGVSDTAIRHYLSILSETFMIRLLPSWHINAGKRVIKSPKIYFKDSGLLHYFLNISTKTSLKTHPKLGASFEGFAIEMWVRHHRIPHEEVFFWGAHSGAELDLFYRKKGKNFGVEVKYADAPRTTPSMRSAIKELKLSHLWVVYPGKEIYKLDKHITVIPVTEIGNT